MRERPILFTGPMIRALLDGSKTQTRRLVKPQPVEREPLGDDCWSWHNGKRDVKKGGFGISSGRDNVTWWMSRHSPYGVVGDRLWVKETWRPMAMSDWDLQIDYAADGASRYLHDGEFEPGDWMMPKAAARGNVSPLFMPRWASRLTLTITDVRVERLQEISRGDAMAEGCPFPNMADGDDPRLWYSKLWEQINGTGSWSSNPWVWVLTFAVSTSSGDANG